ncbi:carboxypeptidase-like regulatory domain-containing protein, partial [Arthrospira platensis SPKY1]|nr:carboxypeptidase-like regulatory domain-containing protein [Arthrospira platensis SPKY1]
EEALYELAELTGVPISFSNAAMEPFQDLHFNFYQQTLDEILTRLLDQVGYHHEWLGRYVLIVRDKEKPKKRYTLSGYLRDAVSGEPLIAANVYTSDQLTGTSTNEYGYYCLTLTEGPEAVTFSFLGYKS